ncbi:MAG: efflux RND transporter periplasmic adaptor subunit [Planctomycetia bacterium]|nr:efflux RND transporter periplasmic adaptor subunit [Planctomycetia bacterium]
MKKTGFMGCLGTLTLCLTTIVGCQKKVSQPTAMTPPVVVLKVAQTRDVQRSTTFPGKTVPYQTVDIVPRVKGYLEEINFVPGEIVKPGQVLFTIQDFDYKVAQSKAYAELKSAVTELDLARSLYESAVKTNQLTPNTVTADEMVQKKARVENAQSKVYAAQANYQYQTQQLYYTKVKSPIRGKVQKNLVDVGNYVQGTGAEILTSVVEMDPMYVEFDVPEEVFSRMYRRMVQETGGPTIGSAKPATANNSAPQEGKLTAPPIPAADQAYGEKLHAQPAFTGEHAPVPPKKEQTVSAPENPSTSQSDTAQPAATAEEKPASEPAAMVGQTSPEIPTPAEDFDVKGADSSGTGLAGERQSQEEKLMEFELTFMGGESDVTCTGVIIYADNRVNAKTGTILCRGEFQNPHYEVYPGRICNVRINGSVCKDALVVDERAVCSDLNSKYLWVVDAKGVVEKRPVLSLELLPDGKERMLEPYREEKVRNMDGFETIVRTGIQPGEQYIVEGYQKVRPGTTVSPKSTVMP